MTALNATSELLNYGKDYLRAFKAIRKLEICKAKNDIDDFKKYTEQGMKLNEELRPEAKVFLARRLTSITVNMNRREPKLMNAGTYIF